MNRNVIGLVVAFLALSASSAVEFSNDVVKLTFDGKGILSSIHEKSSGLELVGTRIPFVEVRDATNGVVSPVSMTFEGGRLVFAFENGSCVLQVVPFEGGWTFECLSCDVPEAEKLVLAQVIPSCNARKGDMSNAVLDDRNGVIVRGYRPEVRMTDLDVQENYDRLVRSRKTCAWVSKEFGFAGHRVGLAAGPCDKLLGMLQNMAVAGDALRTPCGGPWSLSSDANRASYLFGTWMDLSSVDDWIRLMEKSGCRLMHFHAWWKTRGHYEVDTGCFPRGMDDMLEACRRFRARGKRIGMHTLSAAVQFGDPFVAPKWFDDCQTDAEYTLARPFRRGDTELYVNEKPCNKHVRILTGETNGNILRIGDDLLQYADFTTEPPYRFIGVTLSSAPYGDIEVFDDTQAVATTADAKSATGGRKGVVLSRESYPTGHAVSYLHHRYAEFAPKPGSKLAEATTDCLADVFNRCGMEEIFFDGMEICNTSYSVDWLRDRTFAKLHQPATGIISGSSMRSADNWWYRSVFGYWDHPTFMPKVFHNRHIAAMAHNADTEFLRTDLGWWNIRTANVIGRGYFPDEAEYFGCKSAAVDATTSVIGGGAITDGPLSFAADLQFTISGWWENLRYARAFKPGLQERLRGLGREFRIRQNTTGAWCVTPYETRKHAVTTPDFASWCETFAEARPAEIRIEALYEADFAAGATNRVRMMDVSMLGETRADAAEGMTVAVAKGRDARIGETVKLTAANVSASKRNGWARLVREIPVERNFKANDVTTLWVKGDGSGAVINFQLTSAKEFGTAYSENFLALDFEGWSRVELLVREPGLEMGDCFDWPYDFRFSRRTPAPMFRRTVRGRPLSAVSVYVANVEPGRSATVEFGAWDTIPQKRGILAAKSELKLNGTSFALPFALPSGDYAELAEGAWTHYSERGEPLERVAASVVPAVGLGVNELAIASFPDSQFARAEVTVFPMGVPEVATAVLTSAQKRELSVEYEWPRIFNPGKGLVADVGVRVRPGETACLGFEILGPAKNPVVAGQVIPVTLATKADKVVCEDGVNWKAVRVIPGTTGAENRLTPSRRLPLGEGVLVKPLILAEGTTHVKYDSEVSGSRVTFVKYYVVN